MSSDIMGGRTFDEVVAEANGPLRSAAQAKLIGEGKPRFELYHSPPSLCSHKVRTVLLEKELPFLSHDMRIIAGNKSNPDNYYPGYVRLRLLGAPDAKMVEKYTGQSSVTTEGFDPCVVPTLVDHDKNKVVVDSSEICMYLDREGGTPNSLIPAAMDNEIKSQIELIDQAPHVASLYGAHPDGDVRPQGLAGNIKGVHAKKERALDEMIAMVPDEPKLIDAYKHKIAKERSAHDFIYDAASMRDTHKAMVKHVESLNELLNSHDGQWTLGDDYTMADIMWTVSVYRVMWLGIKVDWQSMPAVTEYMERAIARPSFQEGVIKWWGGYSPSPHVKEFRGPLSLLKFIWVMR